MSVSFPKPLTDKEEKYYISLWENGDENAKNILIERNLRLVAHIAKNTHPIITQWMTLFPSVPLD